MSSILPKAYYGHAELETFIVPAGTTTIGEYAFANCANLRKVYIPASVTVIEKSAFENCPLLEIFCEGEPVDGWVDKTETEHLSYDITTPEDDAFNFHRSGGSFTYTRVERDVERHYCWNISNRPVHTHVAASDVEEW